MPMGFIAALNFGHDLQNLRLRKFLREQANGHSESNLYSFPQIKTFRALHPQFLGSVSVPEQPHTYPSPDPITVN